jgi:hypothetical protein
MTEHASNLPFCCQEQIGSRWKYRAITYSLAGIMLGDDDWYYVMWPVTQGAFVSEIRLLSCVGSIEAYGYEPEET